MVGFGDLNWQKVVGLRVIEALGRAECLIVGFRDGANVGRIDGTRVGFTVGTRVGLIDGLDVYSGQEGI